MRSPTGYAFHEFMALHPELWGQCKGFKEGTGGEYGEFGAATRTWLHGTEAVVPKGSTPELATDIASAMPGGPSIVVHVHAEGAHFQDDRAMDRLARKVIRHIPRQLRLAGALA